MRLKEYLQFLAMMFPTILVLGALALSLAFPAGSAGAPASVEVAVWSAPQMAEELVESTGIEAADIVYPR